MIVPASRLLFWVVTAVLPLAILLATDYALLGVIGITLFLALALTDLALALNGLDGVRLSLPPVIRLSRDRDGTIPVQVANERRKGLRLKLGLGLPQEIETSDPARLVQLPPDAELAELNWPCLPRRRGHYTVRRAYLETDSPLGLWSTRSTNPLDTELRVYPNLHNERRNLAALFLNRGGVGIHALRQVGKGRDFEKLREYIPGDSFDEIHWKATAKRGHPVTKVFQIERTQEVYVLIDASRLSARSASPKPAGTEPADEITGESLLERFINAALVLALAAEQQGDLFGLATFSSKVDTFVRARSGKSHFHHCRDALYTLESRVETPDFEEIATFVRLRLRRRALLIVLTALDDPVLAEGFVHSMDLICRQHLVLVNMLKPPGVDPLFSEPDVRSLDDLYQRLGGHLRWHDLRQLQKVLQRRGVRFSLLDNEHLTVNLVSQYMAVKQRQLI